MNALYESAPGRASRALSRALIPAAFLLAAAQTSPAQTSPAATLEKLLAQQQQAVQAGDSASIVPTSKALAAYALQIEAAFYTQSGDTKQAEASLQQSFTIDPAADVGLELLNVQLQAKEPASATADALLALAVNSSAIYLAIGNVFQQAGDLDRAIQMVGEGVAREPASAVAHLALGTLYWTLNDQQYNPDTLREFTQAHTLDAANPLIARSLGAILSQYHRFAEAQPLLEQAAADESQALDASFQLGMNSYEQNQLPEAQSELQKVVTLAAGDQAHIRQLSRALFVLSRIAAQQNNPQQQAALAAQSASLSKQIAEQGGGTVFSESVGVDANATVQPAHAKTPPRATPADRQIPQQLAAQLKTITAQSLNDAGTSLAREHQYAAALPFFEQAAQVEPTLVPVERNLGLAAYHLEDWPTAAKALAAALEQNPADELARRDLEDAQSKLPPAGTNQPQ